MQDRITFRATTTLKTALKAEARRDKRKLSNFIVLLLEEALRQRRLVNNTNSARVEVNAEQGQTA